MPQLAPAPPVMEMNEDEPLNKKPRQEDHLIPEDVFMQCHKVIFIILLGASCYSLLIRSEPCHDPSSSPECLG